MLRFLILRFWTLILFQIFAGICLLLQSQSATLTHSCFVLGLSTEECAEPGCSCHSSAALPVRIIELQAWAPALPWDAVHSAPIQVPPCYRITAATVSLLLPYHCCHSSYVVAFLMQCRTVIPTIVMPAARALNIYFGCVSNEGDLSLMLENNHVSNWQEHLTIHQLPINRCRRTCKTENSWDALRQSWTAMLYCRMCPCSAPLCVQYAYWSSVYG